MITGLDFDAADNGYLTDRAANNVRRWGIAGSWGGSGVGNGQFSFPEGIATDATGAVYVVDRGNYRIQKFTGAGNFVTKWGSQGSGNGQFQYPWGIDVDNAGYVYVSDTVANRVQKFDSAGNYLGDLTGPFSSPRGVAADAAGNVYVGDFSGSLATVKKFDASGTPVGVWGTPGSGPGQFICCISAIQVDAAGDVYVADSGNHRVQKFTPAGVFIDEIKPQAGDPAINVDEVAIDSAGTVYLVSSGAARVDEYVKGGQVRVNMTTIPSGGSATFSFGGGLTPASITLPSSSSGNTGAAVGPPGSGYSVSATSATYQQTAASCSGGQDPSSITLAIGQVVTCNYTFRRKPALTVIQDSAPNDPQDFSFDLSGGPGAQSFLLDDDGFANNGLNNTRTLSLEPGTSYTLTQNAQPGWDAPNISCTNGVDPSNINMALEANTTCRYTNVLSNAGFVVLREDAQPNSGQDFRFDGLPTPVFLDDDATAELPSEASRYVYPGTYNLHQVPVANWLLTSATCSDGSPVYALEVSPNETVTCTWVNQATSAAIVRIALDSVPDDYQPVTFTAGGGLNGVGEAPTFQLQDEPIDPAPAQKAFVVAPGSGYSASQAVPAGWDQASATCSDGSPVSNISASAGEDVTCTFTNHRKTRLTITQDTQPDDPQDFSFTASGGLSPASFPLDDDGDAGNGTPRSQTFNDFPTGTYSIDQAVPSGWSQFFGVCSDGSPISAIDVSAGEQLTCMVGNRHVGDPLPASGTGAGGTAAVGQTPALSADGRLMAFATDVSLSPDDSGQIDIYVRDLRTGDVKLASRATGANGAKGNSASVGPSISGDGRYVVFWGTSSNLSPDDHDTTEDIFVRDTVANTTTLVSRASGASGAKSNGYNSLPVISGNGRYVVWQSQATSLSPDDTSIDLDIYMRDLQSATTTLVSRVPGASGAKANDWSRTPAVSADGQVVTFESRATNLSPDDTDSTVDVYARDVQAGTNTLVSRATGASGAKADRISGGGVPSADGRYVAFGSQGSNLDPDDTAADADTFRRDLQTNTTILVSRADGVSGAKAGNTPFDASISADGRLVAFTSSNTLDPAEHVPATYDVFLRDVQAGTTRLISRITGDVGEGSSGGSYDPAISADGRFVAFSSSSTNLDRDFVPGFGWGGAFVRDTQTDVTSLESRGSPTYARPKAATPFWVSFVPAYTSCGTSNRQHAAPLVFGSCSPVAQESQRLTTGTPDANSQPAKSVASLKTAAVPGNATTPADEADVILIASITDIRNTSGLTDYTGELEVRIPVQVTDRVSYPPTGGQGPGTTTSFDLSLAIPCAATADTTIGGSCDLNTTADALLPGTATESARAIWSYGQVTVYDGGPDSDADTQSGNTPFLRQGIFVP